MKKVSAFERVVILGIDGAGRFFADADTPNLDRIFKNGALNYDVLTERPTISAQCWGSMMTGVSCDVHKLTNGTIRARPPVTEKFPSIFAYVKKAYPECELASFCDWSPINIGLVEDGMGVFKVNEKDDTLFDRVIEYIEAGHAPKLMFVHADSVDRAGHRGGYGKEFPEYLKQISVADRKIGRVYDALGAKGLLENALFIVTADHGGTPGGDHGGDTDGEKYVFFGAAGRGVLPGKVGDMLFRDIAAVALHALGISLPADYSATVPAGLFEDCPSGIARPLGYQPKTPPHRTGAGLPAPDDIPRGAVCYLPFDGDTADRTGNYETVNSGKLYFVDGFCGKSAVFDDGWTEIKGLKLGRGSFTIAAWLKTDRTDDDLRFLLGNKGWKEPGDGFALFLGKNHLTADIPLKPEKSARHQFPYPDAFASGWTHMIATFDAEKKLSALYFDFKPVYINAYEPESGLCFDRGAFLISSPDPEARMCGAMDEFILFDRAFGQEDVSELKKRYGM